MAKFVVQMVGGVGVHDTGKTNPDDGSLIVIRPGEKCEADQPLHELFPDKFRLIEELAEDAAAPASGGSAPAAVVKKPAKKAAKPSQALPTGEDVTAKFPSAQSAGLIVVKIGDLFSIRRGDEELANGLQTEALVVSEIDEIAAEPK